MDTKKVFINQLVDKHNASLIRFLTKKLKNQHDAVDVAQDAYLKMYMLEDPQELDNARAFLFQTASNMAIDRLRRKSLHIKYVQSEINQQQTADDPKVKNTSPSAEQTITAEQQLTLIKDALSELPINARQAFLLHRTHEMTYSDIAKEMDVSVSAVEKYISQALKHFHRKLL